MRTFDELTLWAALILTSAAIGAGGAWVIRRRKSSWARNWRAFSEGRGGATVRAFGVFLFAGMAANALWVGYWYPAGFFVLMSGLNLYCVYAYGFPGLRPEQNEETPPGISKPPEK